MAWKGEAPVGRQRKNWQNILCADMRMLNVDPRDVHGRKILMAIYSDIGLHLVNSAESGTLP